MIYYQQIWSNNQMSSLKSMALAFSLVGVLFMFSFPPDAITAYFVDTIVTMSTTAASATDNRSQPTKE